MKMYLLILMPLFLVGVVGASPTIKLNQTENIINTITNAIPTVRLTSVNYTGNLSGLYVQKAGDTMTGNLTTPTVHISSNVGVEFDNPTGETWIFKLADAILPGTGILVSPADGGNLFSWRLNYVEWFGSSILGDFFVLRDLNATRNIIGNGDNNRIGKQDPTLKLKGTTKDNDIYWDGSNKMWFGNGETATSFFYNFNGGNDAGIRLTKDNVIQWTIQNDATKTGYSADSMVITDKAGGDDLMVLEQNEGVHFPTGTTNISQLNVSGKSYLNDHVYLPSAKRIYFLDTIAQIYSLTSGTLALDGKIIKFSSPSGNNNIVEFNPPTGYYSLFRFLENSVVRWQIIREEDADATKPNSLRFNLYRQAGNPLLDKDILELRNDGTTKVYGNLTIGKDIVGQANITMQSPDGTEWNCGVDNSGVFSCS